MIPYLGCMLSVAAALHLPPRVLPVIQALEGGRPGMVTLDTNGTADLGVMQVNTLWLPAIAGRAGLSLAGARQALLNDPCFNIAASGLILQSYREQEGGALLPAIGDYHSHTRPLRGQYVTKAEAEARELFQTPGKSR